MLSKEDVKTPQHEDAPTEGLSKKELSPKTDETSTTAAGVCCTVAENTNVTESEPMNVTAVTSATCTTLALARTQSVVLERYVDDASGDIDSLRPSTAASARFAASVNELLAATGSTGDLALVSSKTAMHTMSTANAAVDSEMTAAATVTASTSRILTTMATDAVEELPSGSWMSTSFAPTSTTSLVTSTPAAASSLIARTATGASAAAAATGVGAGARVTTTTTTTTITTTTTHDTLPYECKRRRLRPRSSSLSFPVKPLVECASLNAKPFIAASTSRTATFAVENSQGQPEPESELELQPQLQLQAQPQPQSQSQPQQQQQSSDIKPHHLVYFQNVLQNLQLEQSQEKEALEQYQMQQLYDLDNFQHVQRQFMCEKLQQQLAQSLSLRSENSNCYHNFEEPAEEMEQCDSTKEEVRGAPIGVTVPALAPEAIQKAQSDGVEYIFPHIAETHELLRLAIASETTKEKEMRILKAVHQYTAGCRKEYDNAIQSPLKSRKLARSISRVLDLLRSLTENMPCLDIYMHRICELVALYISCELSYAKNFKDSKHWMVTRITYIVQKHLGMQFEHCYKKYILQMFVFMPEMFNEREVMCKLFDTLLPKHNLKKQQELEDREYIQYIIIFYQWKQMESDPVRRELLIDNASRFMRPSETLSGNRLYAGHLPEYASPEVATRTILENLEYFHDLRNASIDDNSLSDIYDSMEPDEPHDDASWDFGELYHLAQPSLRWKHAIKLDNNAIIDSVDLTKDCDMTSTNQSSTGSQIGSRKLSVAEPSEIITLDSDSDEESVHNRDEDVGMEPELFAVDFEVPEGSSGEDPFYDTDFSNHDGTSEDDYNADSDENTDGSLRPRFSKNIRTYLPPRGREQSLQDFVRLGSDLHTSTAVMDITHLNKEDGTSSSMRPTTSTSACLISSAESTKKESTMPRIVDSFSCRRDSIHLISTPAQESPSAIQLRRSEREQEMKKKQKMNDRQQKRAPCEMEVHEEEEYHSLLSTTTSSSSTSSNSNALRSFDKVIYSQANFTRRVLDFHSHSEHDADENPGEKQIHQTVSTPTLNTRVQKPMKKQVKFNEHPIGPTPHSVTGTQLPVKPPILINRSNHNQPPIFSLPLQRSNCASPASSTSSVAECLKQIAQKEHIEAIASVFSSYKLPKTSIKSSSGGNPKKANSARNSHAVDVTPRDLPRRRTTISERHSPNLLPSRSQVSPTDVPVSVDIATCSRVCSRTATPSPSPARGPLNSVKVQSKQPKYTKYDDPKLKKRCIVVIERNNDVIKYEKQEIAFINQLLEKQREMQRQRALKRQECQNLIKEKRDEEKRLIAEIEDLKRQQAEAKKRIWETRNKALRKSSPRRARGRLRKRAQTLDERRLLSSTDETLSEGAVAHETPDKEKRRKSVSPQYTQLQQPPRSASQIRPQPKLQSASASASASVAASPSLMQSQPQPQPQSQSHVHSQAQQSYSQSPQSQQSYSQSPQPQQLQQSQSLPSSEKILLNSEVSFSLNPTSASCVIATPEGNKTGAESKSGVGPGTLLTYPSSSAGQSRRTKVEVRHSMQNPEEDQLTAPLPRISPAALSNPINLVPKLATKPVKVRLKRTNISTENVGGGGCSPSKINHLKEEVEAKKFLDAETRKRVREVKERLKAQLLEMDAKYGTAATKVVESALMMAGSLPTIPLVSMIVPEPPKKAKRKKMPKRCERKAKKRHAARRKVTTRSATTHQKGVAGNKARGKQADASKNTKEKADNNKSSKFGKKDSRDLNKRDKDEDMQLGQSGKSEQSGQDGNEVNAQKTDNCGEMDAVEDTSDGSVSVNMPPPPPPPTSSDNEISKGMDAATSSLTLLANTAVMSVSKGTIIRSSETESGESAVESGSESELGSESESSSASVSATESATTTSTVVSQSSSATVVTVVATGVTGVTTGVTGVATGTSICVAENVTSPVAVVAEQQTAELPPSTTSMAVIAEPATPSISNLPLDQRPTMLDMVTEVESYPAEPTNVTDYLPLSQQVRTIDDIRNIVEATTVNVIKDATMTLLSFEATPTVPTYLFNGESRDVPTPTPITRPHSAVNENVADINNSQTDSCSLLGTLVSALSTSDHEVSSTQESVYEKTRRSSSTQTKPPEPVVLADEATLLVQNNQVDTTHHMCENPYCFRMRPRALAEEFILSGTECRPVLKRRKTICGDSPSQIHFTMEDPFNVSGGASPSTTTSSDEKPLACKNESEYSSKSSKNVQPVRRIVRSFSTSSPPSCMCTCTREDTALQYSFNSDCPAEPPSSTQRTYSKCNMSQKGFSPREVVDCFGLSRSQTEKSEAQTTVPYGLPVIMEEENEGCQSETNLLIRAGMNRCLCKSVEMARMKMLQNVGRPTAASTAATMAAVAMAKAAAAGSKVITRKPFLYE